MPDSITSFDLERSTDGTNWFAVPGSPLPSTARSFDDSTIPDPTLYYRLTGHTANGVTINYNVVSISSRIARGFGGTQADAFSCVTTDASGNVYAAGYFRGTASFGGSTFTSAGFNDLVIAKYDSGLNHVWSRAYGSSASEDVSGICLDSSGNVIVCGSYYSGAGNFGGSNIANAGQYDCFLAKYDNNGNHLWSKGFGGAGRDLFLKVGVDASDNIIVAGTFQSAGVAVSFGGAGLATSGNVNIVLAKYQPDGTHTWSKNFPSGSNNEVYDMVVKDGAIYLTGGFIYSIDFGTGYLYAHGNTFSDLFVAKFNLSGNCLWAKSYGTTWVGKGTALAVDSMGDVIVGGFFYNTTDMGSGTVSSSPVGADNNIFLAKYSSVDGSFVWGNVIGGNIGSSINSIAVDSLNHIYLTGYYYGNLTFDTTTIASRNSGYDIFVAKASPSGSFEMVKSYGGNGSDWGNSIVIDPSDNAILAGFFQGIASFGGLTLTSNGDIDAFLLKGV